MTLVSKRCIDIIAVTMDRLTNLNRVDNRSTPWDLIVIGGGATGVGCALDAASRGLDVLLLEQHDFGKGTSSRSTKLIHGGVRYLRQGDISLVREALRERSILLENAPHVVEKAEFVIPCFSLREKLFYAAGLKLYDLLAGPRRIGASRILSAGETAERLPTLKRDALAGGVLYHDARFDDARLLIDMAATADSHGACLINYARVKGFVLEKGKIAGVRFVDDLSGDEHAAFAKSVINAAGIFSDTVRSMATPAAGTATTYSQGAHVVLGPTTLASDTALMIPKTNDGRVLFCIPWHEHLLIGTTETPVAGPVLEPRALDAEVDFILATAGQYLTPKPTRSDVLSVFAGIRPLVKRSGSANTASLSRSHQLFVEANGLVTIAGGKWTTYRAMADEAVTAAMQIARLGRVESRTERLAIIPPKAVAGTELIHPGLALTREDVVGFVKDEMAWTVEDVLARRSRCLLLNAEAAAEAAMATARIMGELLGKDKTWCENEAAGFVKLAETYRLIGES